MSAIDLRRNYDLVIFDWAGTMVDFGCCAPVSALLQAFRARGVTLSEQDVRRDMGKAKVDHVEALLRLPRVTAAWQTVNGAAPSVEDRDSIVLDLGPLMREQAGRTAKLIDGALAAVTQLRAAGFKIGSSTGYTREMMAPVLDRAAAQGYEPDHLVCSGETPHGRPSPLMIYKACVDLDVWPLSRVIKVDDTAVGIIEGKSAGCFTIGVAASGNGVGLSTKNFNALSNVERRERINEAKNMLLAAGADLVIDSVADLISKAEQMQKEPT